MVATDRVSMGAETLSPYIVRELSHLYTQATPEQVDRGRDWYPCARRWAANLATETGFTVEQVVTVMAITSPGAQLVSNIRWTESALRAKRSRKRISVGRFPNTIRPKIHAVLRDPAYAHAYVTGPKVGPFFRAILGDESALVIDRWAFRAATGSNELNQLRPKLRRSVESAYLAASTASAETLRAFQAIVWIVLRESTPHEKTGTVHKLQDIAALAA
jgi:hypothetical protein